MRPGNNARRPRGRPNRKQHGAPRAHSYDSHGPDVRIRGNAPQIYDKYITLARDATASGDRIAAESYYQFAEHYFRIMNDSTDPRRPPQQPQQPQRISQEQPIADQEQPQVDWPVQVDGANGDAGKEPEQAEERAGEEPAAPAEEPPRRAAKGRTRSRRRSANGAKDPSAKPAAGAKDSTETATADASDGGGESADTAQTPDDSESAST